MKKTALILTGVMLAGAVFPLAACGGGGSIGKVNGNFKEEATPEQISESLSQIDMAQSFDMANGVGFEVKANFDFDMSKKTTIASETEEANPMVDEKKMTVGANAEYKLTAALPEGEQVPVVLGAGKFDFNTKGESTGPDEQGEIKSESTSQKLSATVYNDTQYVYLDSSSTGDVTQSASVKYDLSDIIEKIGKIIGNQKPNSSPAIDPPVFSPAIQAEISGEITAKYDLSTMLTVLQAQGFKVYLDTAKGVKIKISADEDTVRAILASTEIPLSSQALTFSACGLDIYLVFDKEGKFTQLGVDVNVSANYSVNVGGNEMSGSIKVKGGISVKTYAGKVTLPEGIAEDDKYALKDF